MEPDPDQADKGDETIEAVNRMAIAPATREAYEGRLKHFVAYLRNTDPDLVRADGTIDLARLDLKQFQLFLYWRHDEERASFAVLESYRSALVYAFNEAKLVMPDAWKKKLNVYYAGLRNKDAQERQAGTRKLTTGKEAMPRRLYMWLCDYFIRDGNVFAWAYLCWAWNSMCRTSNVADIHLGHLKAMTDSLGLHVPKSKADQGGLRAHIAWLVFANPVDVCQCPVTALAAYLAMDELHDASEDRLFVGGNQESRFAKDMREALASTEGKALLTEMGRPASAYSPHSVRKGSATAVSSGTTHAPSFSAVKLRAGWSLGNVLNRYFQYNEAADGLIGRILAGLDVNSPDFALLPPHFNPDTVPPPVVARCFPGFRSRADFAGVLRFVLPSLVFHHGSLARMLPAQHRLRASPLFVDTDLRRSLAAQLVTGTVSPHMTATGVPAHTDLLRQIKGIATAVGSEPATETKARVATPTHKSAFQLPLVGPLMAWRLLLRGIKGEQPPFRLLKPADFPGQTQLRKRLSDWLYFYQAMLEKLPALDEAALTELADDDTEQRLTELFHEAWAQFDFGPASKITVRTDQWKLATVVYKLREMSKGQTDSPTKPKAKKKRAAPPSPPSPPSPPQEDGMVRKLVVPKRPRRIVDSAALGDEETDDGATPTPTPTTAAASAHEPDWTAVGQTVQLAKRQRLVLRGPLDVSTPTMTATILPGRVTTASSAMPIAYRLETQAGRLILRSTTALKVDDMDACKDGRVKNFYD